jgi:hypothetical protein
MERGNVNKLGNKLKIYTPFENTVQKFNFFY